MASLRELEDAGVVDPSAPWAADRMRAIELLIELGATIEDLKRHHDGFGLLASKLVNGGQPTMSRRDLAHRVGLTLEVVERLSLAAGLPDPGPDVASANEADVSLFQTFGAATAIFGEETAFQLARVVGGSAAKMADAIVSAYRATIAPQALANDDSGLAIVESNLNLAALRPTFMRAVEQLVQRHVANLTRPLDATTAAGYDSQVLAVGFMDLVGSTALGAQLSTKDLSALLTEFEATSADVVVQRGGRVIKLIGDEVMFIAVDPDAAARIATALVSVFDRHPVISGVRVGLAYGEVLSRDGDCFGPVVNLASRVVGCAGPNQALVEPELAEQLSRRLWRIGDVGEYSLKGFADSVMLYELRSREAH
jgi:class 3 adenylate cyclase